jgi:hypothetical protein
LLKDYELAREDDRVWFPFVGTVVALLITAVGAGALSPGFDCVFKGKSGCTPRQELVLAGLPIVPLAGIAMVALLGMFSTVRQRYMHDLEQEIRRALQIEGTGGRVTSGDSDFYLMSWVALSGEINTTRKGQALYRMIVTGLFLGLIAIYAGVTTIIGVHVGATEQALMTVAYSFSGLVLIGVALKIALGPHVLYEEITESREARRQANGARPAEGLLYKKLLIPRQLVLARLPTLLLLSLLLAAVALGRFPDWRAVELIAVASVFFELGIYSARDQWEFLHADGAYHDNPSRYKLNVSTTLAVLLYRLAIPAIVLWILAPEQVKWAGGAIALVFLLNLFQRGRHATLLKMRIGGPVTDTPRLCSEEALPAGRAGRAGLIAWVLANYTIRGLVAWRIAAFAGAEPGLWAVLGVAISVAGGAVFGPLETSGRYGTKVENAKTSLRRLGRWAFSRLLGPAAAPWLKNWTHRRSAVVR